MAREEKWYDQDINYYFCKVFTLKFALYREYYNDLQEKGLKMKAKKKIMRLIRTRVERNTAKRALGWRKKGTRRKRRKKRRRRRKKPLKIRSDVAKTTARWKKIGKRGPFNIIKEILQDCGLFGLENLRD